MGDLDTNKQVLELNVEKQLWEKEERGSSGDVGKDNMPGMCEPLDPKDKRDSCL